MKIFRTHTQLSSMVPFPFPHSYCFLQVFCETPLTSWCSYEAGEGEEPGLLIGHTNSMHILACWSLILAELNTQVIKYLFILDHLKQFMASKMVVKTIWVPYRYSCFLLIIFSTQLHFHKNFSVLYKFNLIAKDVSWKTLWHNFIATISDWQTLTRFLLAPRGQYNCL